MRDISMHMLDIAQNSITAQANLINIGVTIDESKDLLTVTISDNGIGMDKEFLAKVKSPFETSRTTRKVGLGIPLFAASCERAGKTLLITSSPGVGTTLVAQYQYSHIDRPPIGDVAETIYTLTLMNPQIDFVFSAAKQETFLYDTREIKKKLGGVPITHNEVLVFVKEFLHEGITQVFGGINI